MEAVQPQMVLLVALLVQVEVVQVQMTLMLQEVVQQALVEEEAADLVVILFLSLVLVVLEW